MVTVVGAELAVEMDIVRFSVVPGRSDIASSWVTNPEFTGTRLSIDRAFATTIPTGIKQADMIMIWTRAIRSNFLKIFSKQISIIYGKTGIIR